MEWTKERVIKSMPVTVKVKIKDDIYDGYVHSVKCEYPRIRVYEDSPGVFVNVDFEIIWKTLLKCLNENCPIIY